MSGRSSHQGSWEWAGGSSENWGGAGRAGPFLLPLAAPPPLWASGDTGSEQWTHQPCASQPSWTLKVRELPRLSSLSLPVSPCPPACLPPLPSRIPRKPILFLPTYSLPPSPSNLSEPQALLASESFFSFCSPQ